jgi:hypothetical protein
MNRSASAERSVWALDEDGASFIVTVSTPSRWRRPLCWLRANYQGPSCSGLEHVLAPIYRQRMIGLSISSAAFDALAATLPLGSIAYEPTIDDKDERFIWLGPNIVNRLRAAREQGETYSDVILRLVSFTSSRHFPYVHIDATHSQKGRSAR